MRGSVQKGEVKGRMVFRHPPKEVEYIHTLLLPRSNPVDSAASKVTKNEYLEQGN